MKQSSSLIMMPLGVLYGAVTRARLAAYRTGIFTVSKLPVPVISVGNITTGGTGKTPLVEWVCRALAREINSKKICVLTRGYGRTNPHLQVLVSNGSEVLVSAREAGDEPFLLARNLLGVAAVVANADRVTAGQWAIENLGSSIFVLDDGFQHLRIARDLDIVSIDATNPWGDGALLPHGRLREEASGLSRADCIVITRADQLESTDYLKQSIHKHTSAPILTSRMLTLRLRSMRGDIAEKSLLSTESIGAFCGVGNPSSFFTHLEREGARLVFTHAFPDHHVYEQAELDGLVERARATGAKALVTTAKDAVKLASLNTALPCYELEIEISLDQGDQLIDLIRNRCGSGF